MDVLAFFARVASLFSPVVRVYEAGSFARAASDGFISRQALSKTIAHLEDELGVLFERAPRGVAPTELGRSVYPHVKKALDELAVVGELARRQSSGQAGSFSLALESNAAMTLPAGLLGAYKAARPGVELNALALPGDMALTALEG